MEEGLVDEEKRIEVVCGRMIEKEKKGKRERYRERQQTGMVVADAIHR